MSGSELLRQADRNRITELDVLRGLAAVTVMIYHYTAVFQYGRDSKFPYGNLAVNLFFMISGFVIFMTLSRTRTALDFIVSRFSRLYPVFWAAVLLTQTVIWLAPLAVKPVSWRVALTNLTMLAEPLHVPLVDSVYWSLVIELMFYAIMLSLFLVDMLRHIERLVVPWLLLQIAAAMVSKATQHPIPQFLEVFFLLKYAHFFLAGILCYRLRFEGLTATRQLLLACCLVTQFALNNLWSGLFAIVFFGLFYAMARQRLGWIAVRPLVFLGTISYSLYLIHQNIGYVIMRSLGTSPRPVQIAVAVGVALLLATGLTFLVEQPALRGIRALYKNSRWRLKS
jgi:peptidoglycan/LPS O-acetylase OafA/YrhL